MIYISKEGEVISTEKGLEKVVDLYDSWKAGQESIEISTSGSTGIPKTIKLERAAILASVDTTQKAFDIKPGDLFLCNLNTDYIGGKMMVIRAAELYCDLIILQPTANPFEELNTQKYLIAQNWGKNFFSFVSMQLSLLLQNEQHIQLLRTARAILVGGAAVSQDLRKKIKELELPVFETYGMTETISHIAIKDLRTENTYFSTLDGVTIKTDEDKCLQIKSPSTLDQWIGTNDVVEILSETTFVLKGRKDNIINSGGVKIQLEEVDKYLSELIATDINFFSYAEDDEMLGQKLILITEKEAPNLEEFKDKLPKYHVPKIIYTVDSFEKTESGKTDKKKTLEKLKNK